MTQNQRRKDNDRLILTAITDTNAPYTTASAAAMRMSRACFWWAVVLLALNGIGTVLVILVQQPPEYEGGCCTDIFAELWFMPLSVEWATIIICVTILFTVSAALRVWALRMFGDDELQAALQQETRHATEGSPTAAATQCRAVPRQSHSIQPLRHDTIEHWQCALHNALWSDGNAVRCAHTGRRVGP